MIELLQQINKAASTFFIVITKINNNKITKTVSNR